MTRDKLLNSICPMSKVYDCCIADGDYDCNNCKRLTKEWFDKYDKQIRAEVIDEFVYNIKKHHYVSSDAINSTDYGIFTVGIEQIAEELKAGGKNE